MHKTEENQIFKTILFNNSRAKRAIMGILFLMVLISGVVIFLDFPEANHELKITTREEWLNSFCQERDFACLIPENWHTEKVLTKEEMNFCTEKKLAKSECLSMLNFMDAMEEFARIINSHIHSSF